MTYTCDTDCNTPFENIVKRFSFLLVQNYGGKNAKGYKEFFLPLVIL